MLSDHERQELAQIETRLADDRRLAGVLGAGRTARRRRWPVRALIVFGILLLVLGILADDGTLALEGTVISTVGFIWYYLRSRRPAAGPTDSEHPATRRATPPPDFSPAPADRHPTRPAPDQTGSCRCPLRRRSFVGQVRAHVPERLRCSTR